MDATLPDGQLCEERVLYLANAKRVAELEAEAARKRSEKREADRMRTRRSKEQRASSKADRQLLMVLQELEFNDIAVRAVRATLERLLAAERDLAEAHSQSSIGSPGIDTGSVISSPGNPNTPEATCVSDSDDSDDSDTDNGVPRRSAESFIRSEMEIIRAQARRSAQQVKGSTVDAVVADPRNDLPSIDEGASSDPSPPTHEVPKAAVETEEATMDASDA